MEEFVPVPNKEKRKVDLLDIALVVAVVVLAINQVVLVMQINQIYDLIGQVANVLEMFINVLKAR